jgi:diguanylate cyclase (GGDEF)-like protein/PAS domain S-box-containing protein
MNYAEDTTGKTMLRATRPQGGMAIWIAVLIAVAVGGGWPFVDLYARYGQKLQQQQLQSIAQTAAASFDPDLVGALKGNRTDIGTPAFVRARKRLQRIKAANPDARFVYLMRRQEDTWIFLADAEPSTSSDYSKPGDTYTDEIRGLNKVTATDRPLVEGPYTDSWGDWVTGLAPVLSPSDEQSVAVLGIDISAGHWMNEINHYRVQAGSLWVLFVAVLALFVWGIFMNNRARLKLARLNENLQIELTERRRAEEELRLASAVFNNTAEGIMVMNENEMIESVNPSFEEITGYSAGEVIGRSPKLLWSERHDEQFFDEIRATLRRTGRWQGEIWNRRKDGQVYPQSTTINALRDNAGRLIYYATVFSDITPQKELERRLRELAAVDGLTGTANRRAFDTALLHEWARAARERKPLSLVIVDIDHFKQYNDHYGHLAGDDCLKRIAAAMVESARRPGDLAARYGGEEFAIILPQADADAAQSIAEELRVRVESLHIPHDQSETGPWVTISLGVATLNPAEGSTTTALVANADRALYAAKRMGRNQMQTA